MKWILLFTLFSLNVLAEPASTDIREKSSPKSKERLREAQRSLASINPALKPIQIRKIKAKPIIIDHE